MSQGKKFAFIHIPKNAGSSFKKLLLDGESPLSGLVDYVGHSAPAAVYSGDRKTFLVIRNPIERFCSAFFFRNKHFEVCRRWSKENGLETPGSYLDYLQNVQRKPNPVMSSGAEKQTIVGLRAWPRVFVFQPQSLWFRSPHSVFLQNNLRADWEFFCSAMGLPQVDLPTENKGDFDSVRWALSLNDLQVGFLRSLYPGDFALWETWSRLDVEMRVDLHFN